MSEIRTLNPNYDLTKESDYDLLSILEETIQKWQMCRTELSTAIGLVEIDLVRIAKEVAKRFRRYG